VDAGSAQASVSWTGSGPVFGDSFSHVASPCFTLVNADKSGNGDATATGNIDGHDLGAVRRDHGLESALAGPGWFPKRRTRRRSTGGAGCPTKRGRPADAAQAVIEERIARICPAIDMVGARWVVEQRASLITNGALARGISQSVRRGNRISERVVDRRAFVATSTGSLCSTARASP
jgi:hypothetical protein